MDPLYKIIKQLSEEEFQDIYTNLTANKAEKSALFLETIRTSDNPVEEFLEKQDISASAFYVLKSRLNQKIEDFLLNRLGDPKMEAVHKVFKIYDLIFNNSREISVTTLKRLEKTMLEGDNPSVLMWVYRALKMLHTYDEDQRQYYENKYNESVAFHLASEKASETVMTFFRLYDKYYLGRREKDYNELIRNIEKISNLNNLYNSQRLFIFKSIIHLFARQFLEIPERVKEIMDSEEHAFEHSFEILEKNPEDILYKNLHLIFDFLRYNYYNRTKDTVKENIYFELLDYKIEGLLNNFNFGMDCSNILFSKLNRHIESGTLSELENDNKEYLSKIEVETYRLVTYLNYHLFQAYIAFLAKKYDEAARILYRVRNEVNLRDYPHMDLEVKMFLALLYVLQNEPDLASQLILSLQRQIKKSVFAKYNHAKLFLKILANRQGGKSSKKLQLLKKYVEEYGQENQGKNKILPFLTISTGLFASNGK